MESIEALINFLRSKQLTLATAESCTAGLAASLLASEAGCGQVLEGGYIVYSVHAKKHYLGVDGEIIDRFGLTSEAVAREMVYGLSKNTLANLFLAITGTAESDDELNGVICFGYGLKRKNGLQVLSTTQRFNGDRNQVMLATARHALENLPAMYHQLLAVTLQSSKENK